jgi:hypothetical protein
MLVIPNRLLVVSQHKQIDNYQIIPSWITLNWLGKILFVLFVGPAIVIVIVLLIYAKGEFTSKSGNHQKLINHDSQVLIKYSTISHSSD